MFGTVCRSLKGGQPSGARVVACTGAATAAPIGVPARVDAVAAMADSVPEDEAAGYFVMYSESDVGARGDASMADSDDEDVSAAREDPCADSDDEDSDDENSDDEGLPAAPPAREDSDGSSSDSDDEDDSDTTRRRGCAPCATTPRASRSTRYCVCCRRATWTATRSTRPWAA